MDHSTSNKLKQYWEHLSQRGAENLPYAIARRVVLVNQFCVIAISLNLVYALQVMIIDARGLSIFILLVILACLAFLLVLHLNHGRHQHIARWVLSSIPVATLFTSAWLIGNGAGLQLYLIVIWTLLFLIFTRKELGALVLFSIVYWLGFLVIEFQFTEPALEYDFPEGVIDRIYGLSITGTFLSVALVVGLFFNEINRAEARLQFEYERSENLLKNILPASIANELKAQTENNNGKQPAAIANAHHQATVLFADLVGFTSLSEQMNPGELVHLLNQVFSRFDDLVIKSGLEKIKTIGDAYMLAGGLPDFRPDHHLAVARVALQMQALMPELGSLTRNALQIRIGIHSGPLVAGVIGHHKFAYDIWGDTVNTASRMESHGVVGKIQVSSATRELLKSHFELEPRGPIEIKGKGTVDTWFLLRSLNE